MNGALDPTVVGPALTEAFLRFDLPDEVIRLGLPVLSPAVLAEHWVDLCRHLSLIALGAGAGGALRHALAPLARSLGYPPPIAAPAVRTREGREAGGYRLGPLRAWAITGGLDAHARASPTRAAHRVLRASGEPFGLLTNGRTLRLLISEASHPDSHIAFPLDAWLNAETPPDALGLLLCLTSEPGLRALPRLLEAARLRQARVTVDLRRQARAGLEWFLGAVIAQPDNPPVPADDLWHDGLILIHRLLFILKLEAADDPGRGFSFAATRPWRESFSPNLALGPIARRLVDHGHATGTMLETGLRQLFRACGEGFRCAEMAITPLGGALFGPGAMRVLDQLHWGERAVAGLLDQLLWTRQAGRPRQRVHYGTLDVEVLGGIYESLLELEPGIATVPMTRLRRAEREVVVPFVRDDPRAVEMIPAGRFFLRSGTARKASGSYYTPPAFVRFLVAEALGPACQRASPDADPDPSAILRLRVLDPAMGSGHFLVAACRFLADALLESCHRCHALIHDPATPPDKASALRARLAELEDRDDGLARYLGREGIAGPRALAICRRLVATHCLYGVDSNPLAIELAKLSLWLESHAGDMPLTFLDHRLLTGDSLTGPFRDDLRRLPVGGGPLDPLLSRDLASRLDEMHDAVVREVDRIGATLGRDLADLALKDAARVRLEAARAPLLRLARAWSGAAMGGEREGDDEWQALARRVAESGAWPQRPTPRQAALLARGRDALPWDLAFPEVSGFDAVIGNPPWDVIQHNTRDFIARYDLAILDATTRAERAAIEARVLADPNIARAHAAYRAGFERGKRIANRLYRHQRAELGPGSTAGNLDTYRLFAERAIRLAAPRGAVAMLLPSAFHANEGATGIRRLFLENGLETCLSFENRAGLFDIDSRFKFALVVARRGNPTGVVRCAFYLRGIEQASDPSHLMAYDRGFIEASGGGHLTMMELRGPEDLALARRFFAMEDRFGPWCARRGIRMGRDLHMTDDAARFRPMPAEGWTLHEGKTFHQYTDIRDTVPRYVVDPRQLADKPLVAEAARHFRLCFRDIARSNDERSAIATILPPGVVTGHTVTVEKTPANRKLTAALSLCAVFNSFPFDWLVRQKTATHLSLYLLDRVPMPALDPPTEAALARIAAALCARDARFAPLVGPRADWPMVPDPDARRSMRAEADALVARAYGLDLDAYAQVLGAFGHKSWPEAPAMCLAAFAREATARAVA